MSVPVSRILYLFGKAEQAATIHLGPALPRDLGAAYLGSDLAEARVEAGNP